MFNINTLVCHLFLFIIILTYTIFGYSQIDIFKNYRNNPAYEIKMLEDSVVEVYNTDKNFSYLRKISMQADEERSTANLIISLDTVNFDAYEHLYYLWSSLPVVNISGKYIAIDADKNGKNEIYIHNKDRTESPHTPLFRARIYEHLQDSAFSLVYQFPVDTLIYAFDADDITNDGLLDIAYLGTEKKMHFFKQQTSTSYINTPNFIYNPFTSQHQYNHTTFYDIDNDGNLELIYYLFAGPGDSAWAYSNHVAKYNPAINNFELIYHHRPPFPNHHYTNGISVGDFDLDGKGNFATGGIDGVFYIYEHVEGNEYKVEFTKQLDTYNAYLTTFTNDLDNNGKPEVWIGGDFSSSQFGGVTRLFAFEAKSPGVYEQVYQIDIRGLFSAIDGKMKYVDLDGDGIKDLFLTNGSLMFGFKYDGIRNYYMDFVTRCPKLDSVYITQNLERIDIADLDRDGVAELIPQLFLSKGWPESWEDRSLFLKRNMLSNIEGDEIIFPSEYNIFQNYPNPFNPETKIKFTLPIESELKIIIYNLLGKEIKQLLDETRNAGEYEITWNGTDYNGNKVSSGFYFITFEANDFNGNIFRKTIKSILLK